MDELFGGLARGDAVEAQLGEQPLVPVAPPQDRRGVGEHLLGAHADQPLADALVLLAHRGRRRRLVLGLLPGRLGAVLALHAGLGRALEIQDAQRPQVQELAELEHRAAHGGPVRGVHQHGVAGLERRTKGLQQHVGADDVRRQAQLLWRQLLEDLRRDRDDVVLVANHQSPGCADGLVARVLRRLGQDDDAVVLLVQLRAGAGLLDATDARVSEAHARLVEVGVDHGVVQRHGQHADQDLVVVEGPLDGPRLHVHLHGAREDLAVGVGLGRAEHVLHVPPVPHVGGRVGGVEEGGLHEVLVGHDHLRGVPLPHPGLEVVVVRRRPLADLLRHVHHRLRVGLLGPHVPGHPPGAEALGELLFHGQLVPAGLVVVGALLRVREGVVRLVQDLERLAVAALVRVVVDDQLAELRADLIDRAVAWHAEHVVVILSLQGCGHGSCGDGANLGRRATGSPTDGRGRGGEAAGEP
mmetsp:Transcript_15876/g.47165  ORF Transcript_15876/g.47165 Transcript_15876/m.47165 type:complete len:469 (+) Transcript_15876:1302-2708(+)